MISERHAKYDAIIIGAGVGALVCANLLAKNGQKTLLLEQHSKVGGCVTSYTRKDFTFCVTDLIGGLRLGTSVHALFHYIGITKKVKFVEVEKLRTVISRDFKFDYHADIDRCKQEFFAIFPDSKIEINLYFDEMQKIWNEIHQAKYNPTFFELLQYPFRFPLLLQYQSWTAERFLNKFIQNQQIKDIIKTFWPCLGLPFNRASALYCIAMFMSYHNTGAWVPVGGFQKMSDAFAQCFVGYDGSIQLNAKVKNIIVENSKAIGVELENGKRYFSDIIISNADAKQTFLKLLTKDSLPKKFLTKIKNLEMSMSGITVHLGLRNLAIDQALKSGWIYYLPEHGAEYNNFNKMLNGELNLKNSCLILHVRTLIDDSVASKDDHILRIGCCPIAYDLFNKHKNNYKEYKEAIADVLIKQAENLIPNLSKHIVVKEITTPCSYAKYLLSYKGCWFDAALTVSQSLRNRLKIKTPLKNLYLVGAATYPGTGVLGVVKSGLFVADMILKGRLSNGKMTLKAELRGHS